VCTVKEIITLVFPSQPLTLTRCRSVLTFGPDCSLWSTLLHPLICGRSQRVLVSGTSEREAVYIGILSFSSFTSETLCFEARANSV